MGIQSTTQLTRKEAEERFLTKILEDKDYIKYLKSAIILLTDEELEDGLESTFDNYSIR